MADYRHFAQLCDNQGVTSYTDSSGRSLTDYPRPSVAVDTAVLTVPPGERLCVLLVRPGDDRHRGDLRLPGTFLHESERLADAVLRSLRDKAGVSGLEPVQLKVFDEPTRDDRGWVLSVAHMDAVPFRHLKMDNDLARLVPWTDVPSLPYGHKEIIELAVKRLRSAYRRSPDPSRFLKEPFTLKQLRDVHEKVAGAELMRDTFRRQMEPQLEPTGEIEQGTVGKPARLFRRASG